MSTITVPAPKIEVGDRIDGREVRHVTGRKARTVSNANAGMSNSGSKVRCTLPISTFSGHVVCVHFADDGPPKHYWGKDTVTVERGAEQAAAA